MTGSATVILAMGAGRRAAKSIHEYLTTGEILGGAALSAQHHDFEAVAPKVGVFSRSLPVANTPSNSERRHCASYCSTESLKGQLEISVGPSP